MLDNLSTEVAPQNLLFTGAGLYPNDQILKLRQELLKRQIISRITRKYSTFQFG